MNEEEEGEKKKDEEKERRKDEERKKMSSPDKHPRSIIVVCGLLSIDVLSHVCTTFLNKIFKVTFFLSRFTTFTLAANVKFEQCRRDQRWVDSQSNSEKKSN